MSDLATLRISVDASGAIRVVDQFGRSTETAAQKTNLLTASLKSAALGFASLATVTAILRTMVKETSDAQREQAGLANILATTGHAAERSLEQLNAHADALRRITAFGGGDIADAQRRLLSYTAIVGPEFDRATVAVLNFAQEFGTSTVQAAEAVGKALNYPTVGLGLLSKQGFIFTDVQRAMIKEFEETNQLAKAQAIILGELESVTENAAAAYRNTLPGALDATMEAFKDLFEVTSPGMESLIESINDVADALSLLPTRAKLVMEQMKNVRLQFESFFDLSGGEVSPIQKALARLEGRPEPKPLPTQLSESDTRLAELDRQLREQMAAIMAGRLAREIAREGRGSGLGSPGDDTTPTLTAAAEASRKLDAAVKGLGETMKLVSDKMDRDVKALGKFIDQNAAVYAKTDRLVKEVKGGVDELSESARVFLEQTQIAVARFFSDFLKDGFSSIGRFWDDFKQLGRDAIGNIFAKEFMAGIGGKIADKVSGAIGGVMGKVGGLGAGILGPFAAIGGITAGVFSLMNRTSKWEEAAEAQNKAARAQLAAAETLRMTVAQQQAAFRDNFLNYANTETATEREIRNLANQRTQLGRDAYGIAMTATGGTGLSNQVKQLLESGNFSQTVIDLIRRDAGSLNMSQFARDNLLQFADSLEELNAAFQRNTKAATEAARAQSLLSLTQFRDSLALSAQSPLSPTAQLAEARRQYDVILALAKAGDASAISSLPETARTLLDASRAVNASGMRYADDFAKVTSDVSSIIADLNQSSIDVRDTILERTEPWFADQLAATEATLTVQQQGFQAVVDELVNVKAELVIMKESLKLSLDDVALAVS